jgi:hypothetical protein
MKALVIGSGGNSATALPCIFTLASFGLSFIFFYEGLSHKWVSSVFLKSSSSIDWKGYLALPSRKLVSEIMRNIFWGILGRIMASVISFR